MLLYYIRHGETVWNRQRVLQGRRDSPLTLWGIRLAIAYAERLQHELAERLGRGYADEIALCASPMTRCAQTSAIIADVLGFPAEQIVTDDLLAELDVGEWSGRSWADIQTQHGLAREERRHWGFRPPGGETRTELHARATQWLAKPRIARATVVVSHGGFSRHLRGAFLALDDAGTEALETHAHGRFYRLEPGRIDTLVTEEGAAPAEDLLG